MQPYAIHPRRGPTARKSLYLITCCQCVHRFSLNRDWLRYQQREGLRRSLCCSFCRILRQSSDQLRTPLSVLPSQKVPSLTSFIENHTSSLKPCCPFHCSVLSAGHTDGVSDGSTDDSKRAASKSDLRKRHTLRDVPESAKAFTLPLRAQSSNVRAFTRR